MSNILFFLLAAFGASAVAVFAVTVPIDATGDTSQTTPEDKVTVTLRVDAAGLTLAHRPRQTPRRIARLCPHLAQAQRCLLLAGLTQALVDIKSHFPGSETILVVPDDDLHYDMVVTVFDATRDFKQPDGRRLRLFPEVIMSSLVK